MIKVSHIELFKSLLDLEVGDKFIDLHNDFNCTEINFSKEDQSLIFVFFDHNHSSSLRLVFQQVILVKFNLNFELDKKYIILDNFYRGRFESNNELHDLSEEGKGYMYVEFCEGQSLEFYCKEFEVDVKYPPANPKL